MISFLMYLILPDREPGVNAHDPSPSLVSDAAALVTGQTIAIDAGTVML